MVSVSYFSLKYILQWYFFFPLNQRSPVLCCKIIPHTLGGYYMESTSLPPIPYFTEWGFSQHFQCKYSYNTPFSRLLGKCSRWNSLGGWAADVAGIHGRLTSHNCNRRGTTRFAEILIKSNGPLKTWLMFLSVFGTIWVF